MTGVLPLGATIGIVGGGQLGRMLAMAAAQLGYRCLVLSPEKDCPASQVAAHLCADYDDAEALERFARAVDVATFEFENVSASGLDLLASLVPVRPSPRVLAVSQDRVAEKTFLNAAGVATAPWRAVESVTALEEAVAALGLPCVLKTRRLGYDGKGQAIIRTAGGCADAFASLGGTNLIVEGRVDFAAELSVIVARGHDGTLRAFDPVENRHRDGILDLTLAPARVTDTIASEATALAVRTAEALDLVGLLAVEMFVDADGRVLANEIAPRPHNSGHWTLDACVASQFEMQVRAVCGLPLPPASRHSDAAMRNLIGPDGMAAWELLLERPGAILHHYGKAEARAGRKMAHVTTLFPLGALPGDLGVAAVMGWEGRPGALPLDPAKG